MGAASLIKKAKGMDANLKAKTLGLMKAVAILEVRRGGQNKSACIRRRRQLWS
jgi:predicted ThiF/HesA family dinucleotide-utilizing enzyme